LSLPILLDVNLLIALFDETHVHHEAAHDWFSDNRQRGWVTCPFTENGFIRIVSQSLPGRPAVERPGALAAHLRGLCTASDHVFWSASVSLRDPKIFDLSAAPSRHLTDIYLAGLALANGGVLATFDRSIPLKAVVGASPDLLEVIGA
jgi:toxin-antitoxin system PIN domain toxin